MLVRSLRRRDMGSGEEEEGEGFSRLRIRKAMNAEIMS